jgi:hypothetical protein
VEIYDRVNAMSTRRFWQIHLSTAVVLMVVAGAIMSANFRPDYVRLVSEFGKFNGQIGRNEPVMQPYIRYGWPLPFYIEWDPNHGPHEGYDASVMMGIRNSFLCFNIGCWLAIFATTAITSEFIIRRRARDP